MSAISATVPVSRSPMASWWRTTVPVDTAPARRKIDGADGADASGVAALDTAAMASGSRPSPIHLRAASAFSAVAPLYDGETEANPIVRWVRRRTLRRLGSLFHPGDLVLELG